MDDVALLLAQAALPLRSSFAGRDSSCSRLGDWPTRDDGDGGGGDRVRQAHPPRLRPSNHASAPCSCVTLGRHHLLISAQISIDLHPHFPPKRFRFHGWVWIHERGSGRYAYYLGPRRTTIRNQQFIIQTTCELDHLICVACESEGAVGYIPPQPLLAIIAIFLLAACMGIAGVSESTQAGDASQMSSRRASCALQCICIPFSLHVPGFVAAGALPCADQRLAANPH